MIKNLLSAIFFNKGIVAAMCAMPFLLPTPGQAQDTFNTYVEGGLLYDNNLFRLPEDVAPVTLTGQTKRSDWINDVTLGINLDKNYSLQHFLVNASVTRYSYKTYKYLDYNGRNLNADWIWHLTPGIMGNLIYTYVKTLNNFSDVSNQNIRNFQTRYNRQADADIQIGGGWHAKLALIQTLQRNDQFNLYGDDTRTQSLQPEIRYQFASANNIAAYARTGSGRYLNRTLDTVQLLDTEYHENEAGIQTQMIFDGKSSLTARLAQFSRRNANFSIRDYKGAIGEIDYHWLPTAKIALDVRAARSLFSDQTSESSYGSNEDLTLGPVWQVSGKSALSLLYDRTVRHYRGQVSNVIPRLETLNNTVISYEWNPARSIKVNASFTNSNRKANRVGLQFKDDATKIAVRLFF